MRRTLVAFCLSLGIVACGGVVEDAASPGSEPSNGPSAMAWCSIGDPSCESVLGQACTAGTTRTCCNPWGQDPCTCPKSYGKWLCPLYGPLPYQMHLELGFGGHRSAA